MDTSSEEDVVYNDISVLRKFKLESQHHILQNWTIEECNMLLKVLEEHGSHSRTQIAKAIPTKTKSEITEVIRYYKMKTKNERFRANRNMQIPTAILHEWQKVLEHNFETRDLKTVIPQALRYIAEGSEIPPIHYTSEIDFKKMYHALANAMEGLPLPEMNKFTKHAFKKCIKDGIEDTRVFLNYDILMFCENIMMTPQESVFNIPSQANNPELNTLEYITMNNVYNPFGIPSKFLNISEY